MFRSAGEQEAFAWIREHKQPFSFNTVVRNTKSGPAVSPENISYRYPSSLIGALSKAPLLRQLVYRRSGTLMLKKRRYYILGALTPDNVDGARCFWDLSMDADSRNPLVDGTST